MIKVVLLTLLAGLVFLRSTAQIVPTNIQSQYAMQRLTQNGGISPNETIYGIPSKPGQLVGDFYYDSSFRSTTLFLYKEDQVIRNAKTRYNIMDNLFEIQRKDGLKALDGNLVSAFTCDDVENGSPVFFVNAKQYKRENAQLLGFLEVLADGELPLVAKREIILHKEMYVPQLNTGSKDVKVLKKERYYYVRNMELLSMKGKKNIKEVFGPDTEAMSTYIKEKSISLTKRKGLTELFKYYNESKAKKN